MLSSYTVTLFLLKIIFLHYVAVHIFPYLFNFTMVIYNKNDFNVLLIEYNKFNRKNFTCS